MQEGSHGVARRRGSHTRSLEGEALRLPPSNGRFAPCLPFSDFVLRPRGYTPLEPPSGPGRTRSLARTDGEEPRQDPKKNFGDRRKKNCSPHPN